MKKLLLICLGCIAFLSACNLTPSSKETNSTTAVVRQRWLRPQVPEQLMGKGRLSAKTKAAFLLASNPQANKAFVERLAALYVQEAGREGVNHDVAFAQMCLETGYLAFGGDVSPSQYNFAGLGAVGNGAPGLSFPEPRIGVRAHIQHMKAYGSTLPLKQELVNPRFRYVRRGCAPTIWGLAGTWAADTQYAEKIKRILDRMYTFAYAV